VGLLFSDTLVVLKREPKPSNVLNCVAQNDCTGVVNYFVDEIVTLEESDVPGASLNGKTLAS